MPGGNPTIKHEPLDLGSFLQRKRKPLETWLIQNEITSEVALQNFLKNPEWFVSENLIETIRGFFVISPLQQQKKQLMNKIETLPPPPIENKQEQLVVAVPTEEMVFSGELEEAAEARSALTNRERKKNR